MVDLSQLTAALRNADAAGDSQAAQRIALMIKQEKERIQTTQRDEALSKVASDVGPFESFAISAGKGLYDIGRGLGIIEPASETEKKAFTKLAEQRPISATIGEVTGQAAPFLVPGVGVGAIASTPLRVAAAGLLGATEGATIASAEDKSLEDITKTAGIGGAIASVAEILFPYIGRVASKIYRNVRGVDAPTGLIDKLGNPTDEMEKVMAESGLTIDDIVNTAKVEAGQDLGQTATQAQFKKFGAEPTLGELTQDIAIQKPEQFLLEQTTDESADILRAFKKAQSENIKTNIEGRIDSLGIPEDVGTAIKDALSGRKAELKSNRKKAYEALSQATKNIDQGIPLVTDNFMAKLPDAGTIRDVAASRPTEYKALTGLMAEFGIETNPQAIEQLVKSNIDITPINIDNFESFRKRLGNIERADQTGMIANLTAPIKKALDEEVELATKELMRSGNPDIASMAKEARKSHIALKTEFDDAAMSEILIKPKKRGSNIPNIEESQVYNKLVARSTPTEQLTRVVDSISGSKKALGNLQAQALTDLIDSAFQASSRKIDGTRQFGGAAFQKRFSQLEPKLEIIFRDNPKLLADIKVLNKVAAKLTPPSGAVPKGSAGFFVDSMDKLGIFRILNKIPVAGDATVVALRKISAMAKNKETLDKAVNASPKINESVKMINRDMPAIATLLGLSAYADEDENE